MNKFKGNVLPQYGMNESLVLRRQVAGSPDCMLS